ncbi:flagellar hook-length control protein FliK [Bosea beijingensis]|uniref:flagellar hook-length control protein FliK n=1 Tax=Bosea beijingensis TaxID=3068632 RepID=UPI0027414A5A|nr:flagellar hook-length control protein FliK [Bosea sp. REN20]
MPIQSAFTSQATAEAPVVRSRAGQTEQREGGEVFTLPEAETGSAEAGKAGAAGKAAAASEVVAAKEAAGVEQVVDPAKVKAQLTASQAAVSPAEPVSSAVQTGAATPQQPKAAATGIAFLIAMAAAQAGSQVKPAGEGEAIEAGEAAGETEDGSAKKDSKAAGEGEVATTAPIAAAEVQATVAPVPVAVLPALLPQGPLLAAAEGEAIEASSTEGGAKKDTARPQFAAAGAGLPVIAMPGTEQEPAAGAVVQDGKTAQGVQAIGTAGQGVKELADILAKADQPAAANRPQAPAEAKALDAPQQPATPFDLSTLLQQAPGKSGNERLALPFDPSAAAGNAPGAPGQGTASGQPTPIHVVPIEIGLRAMSGARQFDIRLDPDELGRVDVSLSISDKGEVSARLVVDRVETLQLLQRDARTLERAFEQAGLKPSDGGVDITLRDPSDQSAFRQNRQQDEAPQRPRQPNGIELAEDAPLSVDSVPQRRLIRLGGVDLSI